MASLPEAVLRTRVRRTAQRASDAGHIVASLGNVSARHPRHDDRLLITPSGVSYGAMASADVVTIDQGGRVHRAVGEVRPSSEWRVHAAIYRARPDVHAIVHTHAVHAQAFSFLGCPLSADTEELDAFAGGDVDVADYAASGTGELAENAVRALGSRQAVLLARHGVVSVGVSLDAAYAVAQVVERQAERAWRLDQATELSASLPERGR